MFGEKEIYGQFILSVDDKNRVSLPKETQKEKGDILNLVYDEDLNLYRIYNVSVYNEILEDLSKKIKDAKTKEERIRLKKLYLEYIKNVVKSCRIDKQGRMTIGANFKHNNVVFALGAKDHLILHTSLDFMKK